MATVTEMPPSETPQPAPTATENTPQPAKPEPGKRGRPPFSGPKPPEPKFFDRIKAVDPLDWGTRAFMYVYMDEPVCNPKTFGTTRYLFKSSKPITDLEMLKQDYGSFKGWMSLNQRKTGKDQTDEIDRYDFEIYDPKYPPKIPKSAWANDSRNRRWLDLLPPEPPPASQAASTMLEAMKVYKDIRSELKDEVGAGEPAARPNEILETMRAAKELFAPADGEQQGKPADPFDLAQKIMAMRSEDPMVKLLLQRMESMDKSAESARQREYELQKELRQMQQQQAQPAAQKSLLEQLVELGALKDKLKDVLGIAGEAVTTTARGKTSPWDLARELVPQIINSEFMAGIGQRIAAGALAANPAGPAMSPQNAPAASTADSGEAAFQRWIRDTVNKQVIRYFLHMQMDGDDLADVLYATEPEWTKRLQQFEHPQLPGMKGKEVILALYKLTTSVWPQIQASGRVAEFETFVDKFCNWVPEGEEPAAAPADDGVIDLTTEDEHKENAQS